METEFKIQKEVNLNNPNRTNFIIAHRISSVKSAIKSCENELAKLGEITSTSIIASPHKSLLEKIVM